MSYEQRSKVQMLRCLRKCSFEGNKPRISDAVGVVCGEYCETFPEDDPTEYSGFKYTEKMRPYKGDSSDSDVLYEKYWSTSEKIRNII